MNPYLEQAGLWRGVHTRLLTDLQSLLTPQVVPRYFVELEESLFIDPTQDEPAATATVPAPATVTVPGIARKKVRRLVVRDNSSLEVVTVLELLSPSNKQPGADRDRYVEKRHEVLTSRTSFIELDLLRGGKRLPVRPLPTCDYYALVSRWWELPEMGLWPVHLREPLPRIPVPLRRGEPEPLIDLKAVLDWAYDAAGYEYRIYRTDPEPALAPADAEWARAFVPAVGG
jgi:hypothetical protein